MLDYEWGNPSTIMLSGDDSTQDSDQSRQLFNNYHQSLADNNHNHHHHFLSLPTTANNGFSHHHHHHPHFLSHQQHHHHSHSDIQTLYDDPRHYTTTSYPNPPPAMLTLDPVAGINGVGGDGGDGGAYMMVPKSEEMSRPGGDFTARIGLNLGHRTYFSSDDDFVNRLYRRSRPGPLDSGSVNTPRCQAEGCTSDLTHAKHYHRRHKVCEFHSKASTVIAAGLTQRFCQQCSRFHILSEFDNGKRSCRKRLADHNRRRRKSQHQQQQQQPNHDHDHQMIKSSSQHPENALSISSSETLTRSPPDSSGAHATSSVTVAVSPPRMSLDCFRQRSYNNNGGAVVLPAASSQLLFYSNE